MPYEQRPGSGTLFRNREKKNPNHPDLKGDALVEIDGQLYQLELAAWTKQSERAGKFLSLSVKLKGDRDAGRPRASAQRRPNAADLERGIVIDGDAQPDDSDIPF
jgi:hypothetical protein